MLVTMIVHMSGMMPVMIQAGGCAISLSGIRMARVQRVHRLQVMVMIVNVIQPAMSPSIGVGRRRFTRNPGADMMMIHAGMTGQATGRAAMMMATQRCRRQTAVDVDHVSVHRGRPAMVHHARVGRRTAQSTGSAVMIAGKGGSRVMGETSAGAQSMMTVGRVYVINRSRDGYRCWMMVSGRDGTGLVDGA